MEYRVTTGEYAESDMMAFAKAWSMQKKGARGLNRASAFWKYFACACCFGMCVYSAISGKDGGFGLSDAMLTAGFALMGAYFLASRREKPGDEYGKAMWRRYKVCPFSADFTFGDDGFSCAESSAKGDRSCDQKYSEIKSVIEDDAHVYVLMDDNKIHIVRKSDFAAGSPEGFADFIAARSGREVLRAYGEGSGK